MWRWVTAGAVLVLVTGALPLAEAGAVLARVAPILGFLAAVTVLAELADAAGVFTAAAVAASRAGRGSVPALFLLVAALATATTVVLSLDTTAVLLTPVVLILTTRLGLPAAPFAVLVVWLANTASLLLPVSNLTNLLAAGQLDRIPAPGTSFAAVMAAPAAAVLVATLVVLGLRYAPQLRGRYAPPAPVPVPDRALFGIATVVCAACGLLFAASDLLGVNVAVTATGGALLLLAAFTVRARHQLSAELLPWRLLTTTVGLFLLVQTALHAGLDEVLTTAAGSGTSLSDLLQLAFTAAGAANLVNNLPAYLALEPAAEASPVRLAALLVGTNAGPLILPWGSLATLLWADRCRARGVHIPAFELIVLGVLGVPVVLTVGTLTLTVTSG